MAQEQQVALTPFHWHEILDRGFTCMKLTEQLMLQHPVIRQHEALEAKVAEAHRLLREVCQEVALLSMDNTAV